MCWPMVSKTPRARLVYKKLVYHGLLPNRESRYGSTRVRGAHAGSAMPRTRSYRRLHKGLKQALEEWATLAVLYRMMGKGNNRDALRAYEDVRFERVKKLQKTGEMTSNMWHTTGWC